MKATNSVNINNQLVTNVPAGTADDHPVNLGQLKNAIAGIGWKQIAVACASTGPLTLSGLQTVDGHSTLVNENVLVKNQSNAKYNGLYIAASGAWVRHPDYNSESEMFNSVLIVDGGTVNANSFWLMVTNKPFVIDTDPIVFIAFNMAVSYSGGLGITITNGVVAIDTNIVARKEAYTIGDGVQSVITITHSLNTVDVILSMQDTTSGTVEVLMVDWKPVTNTTILLSFGNPVPTTGQYRVTIVG